ncbi:beta-ketoacyl-[acyl-carrier-protein] synthase family protein [Amycolatopsis alba]|uniref:Secondary metabolite synthesis protein n=1 Tax=Amycolatopsis alba DSM 44262 TaxID=1125972 RepID=A0A229S7M9_AMYAL|nr:beta-ketoacyl-[acyl-carrier-protein] synthase family protein [Amycolatopsis alba]OXM54943.1 secondary metabolite synthesis protein [Amycolatopsis alba DSM 44262]
MSEIVVTGHGVRTVFGDGADALRSGVFEGRAGFGPITRFDTSNLRTGVAACGAGPGTPPLRTALTTVADAAVAMAGVVPGGRTAVVAGAAGDFTAVTGFWAAGQTGRIGDTVASGFADALSERLGASGPRTTFTTACVASASAIIHGCRLIAAGAADTAVCAGGYLVEPENQAKFDSGRALARDGVIRPFSENRSGLLLGDGVAAVVLESKAGAARRDAEVLARVTGWGMASDAHHIARPHPRARGLVLAARKALRQGGASKVGYVNAHGTGTKHNDSAETAGLHDLFGADAPEIPVSSTKSTTGHMLEGAGVVEFVVTLLALLDQTLPPTASFTGRDGECDLDYVPHEARAVTLRRALTVNAAFGGANTAIVLERP